MGDIEFNCLDSELSSELRSAIDILAEEYSLKEKDGLSLRLVKSPEKNTLVTRRDADGFTIEYGRLSAAIRGVGLALANIERNERLAFDMFGVMLDCSRGMVMTVDYVKKWLRRMALMGYDTLMLYTEDTYLLDDEPYFGYARGAYSLDEIKEIDQYALSLGVELIPCIQTLGHMEQVLRWKTYADSIRDTSSVMLVDCDETVKLVGKTLDFWSSAVTSRRIHIGMDETHDLGRGKFMDKFGYERGFDLFNRHLGRVENMCVERGLKPMIWSDMYFRMGNDAYAYYDQNTVIPEEVKQAIPTKTELVYWDYYHDDKAFYAEWIKRHRDLGHEPLMASGIWTWDKFWYDHKITRETVIPCLEACAESNVKEILFTMWGDDGAYCDFDSALAGMAWTAEQAFADDNNPEALEAFFQTICGASYADHVRISSALDSDYGISVKLPCLLWDDPLMGKYYNELTKGGYGKVETILTAFDQNIAMLKDIDNNTEAGDMEFASALIKFIRAKLDYYGKLRTAKNDKDTTRLTEIMERDIPALISELKCFSLLFRRQWLKKNKPFGLDIIQVRLAGQVERFEETARQIKEFIDGEKFALAELSCPELTGEEPEGGSYNKFGLSNITRW